MAIELMPERAAPVALPPAAAESQRFGAMLALWMVLTIILNGVLWLSGARSTALAVAVESGAARAERQAVGEQSDDLIRKATQTQLKTLPFWTALALLDDMAVEPACLGIRAALAAVVFAAAAALAGRPIHFSRALAGAAAAQGFWVLGLAVRTALTIGLRRDGITTSLVLLLPPASLHPAGWWLAADQADAFALLGWAAVARAGWRAGQAPLAVTASFCILLASVEAATRVAVALAAGSAVRLAIYSS